MFTFRPVSRSVYDIANLKMFIFGSGTAGSALIQRYDGITRSTDSSTLTGSYATRMTAVAVNATSWIFSTGNSGGSNFDGITHYNGTSTVVQTATLQEARLDGACGVLSGIAYIFGGINTGGTSFTSIQSYNGTTRLTTGATTSVPLYQAACAALGSTLYVYGGWSGQTGTFHSYNGSTATSIANYGSPKFSSAGATLGSAIYFFGGGTGADSGGTRYNAIYKYNGTAFSTESATLVTTMGGAAATSLSPKIYLFGGYNGANLNTIQSYDGTTRVTESATLANASQSLAATTSSSIISV